MVKRKTKRCKCGKQNVACTNGLTNKRCKKGTKRKRRRRGYTNVTNVERQKTKKGETKLKM